MEETPVDSRLYNKALLARAFDKQMNEQDIRNIIRRSIARDQPRTLPKLKKEEIQKAEKQFTSKEIWDAKVPTDFKGSKIEYLLYCKQEEKEKKEFLNGTSSL